MYKQVSGRYGECVFLGSDEYVGRSMFYYGEYNPAETAMILSLAHGLCLDIGANIGVISQALLAHGRSVEAFEPQPELHTLLQQNCLSAKRIRGGEPYFLTHNVAVGSETGIAKMPKVHYSAKGNFGGLGIGSTSLYGYYDVPVVTIDSYNYDDVGFIKIDVEGYEYEVLCGASETIARCRPILYIEDDRTEKSRALRAKIESLGYSIEEHQPPLYDEDNYFGLKRNVWKHNYASFNLICKPNAN